MSFSPILSPFFVVGARQTHYVIPAKAGIQFYFSAEPAAWNWIPAFAGMTSRLLETPP
jgi:hypothetical protein